MNFIRTKRKLVKVILAIALIFSIGINIYGHFHNVQLTNKYESLVCISNHFYQTSLITFVSLSQESDNVKKVIEIFDITKGKVIKKVEPDPQILNAVDSYLNGITGMYVKVKAFPDKGLIVRIPFNPPVKVQTHWLNDYKINSVEEVFLVLPEQGDPFLLVLDEKFRPFFYTFDGDVDVLLDQISPKRDIS